MASADLVWGGIVIAGAAYEGWALVTKRSGDTLSERVRTWFRVRTCTGRAVFTVAWLVFSVWFLIHILS